MKLMLRYFSIICSLFILIGCSHNTYEKPRWKIGFSQCTTNDKWRQEMLKEMEAELLFHPEIDFLLKDAQNNSLKQIKDIQELIDKDIDILIVSPNEATPLTNIIEKTYDSGLPVILIDRKIYGNSYSSFIGADNFSIGKEVGRYLGREINEKVNILEITGLRGSTPAMERYQGFDSIISLENKFTLKHIYDGRWKEENGYSIMKGLLLKGEKIDVVFAHNDLMALGAYKAAKEMGQEKSIRFFGIDGLASDNGGIESVINDKLDATFLYPTGGEVAIKTALDLLNGLTVEKEITLSTVAINKYNAKAIKNQSDLIWSQREKIKNQNEILNRNSDRLRNLRILVYLSAFIIVIFIVLVIFIYSNYRLKRNANYKLKSKNIDLELQKKEISKQKEQLEELNLKIKELNKEKLKFFTNISHEFRTPLALIIAPLQEILNDISLKNTIKERILIVEKNAKRLLILINQLIDFRKIDTSNIKMNIKKTDIVAFTKDIVCFFEDIAKQKNLKLHFNTEISQFNLWYDKEKIEKVIYNLISNAIKYTSKGFIKINIPKPDKKYFYIQIEDSGKGIKRNHIQTIFNRYNHSGGLFDYGLSFSSGIGLALAKELVESHKGKITVDSKEGAGSLFTIILPLGNKHYQNLIIKDKQNGFSFSYSKISSEIENKSYQKTLNEEPSSTNRHTILLVDDNYEIRSFIKSSLINEYNIIEAEDGIKGYELAKTHLPKIIISDLMMPFSDGIELCSKIKRNIKTSHIPFIMLTAYNTPKINTEALQFGADDFISKPFDLNILKLKINNILELREKIQKTFWKKLSVNPKEITASDADEGFMKKVMSVIEKNMENPEFGVKQFAKEVGLSYTLLYNKLLEITGFSGSDFIKNMRLKRAAELLKSSQYNVSEISTLVGFNDPHYFSKCFRKEYGQAPSKFAKS